jgi:thiamine-phosphate pyrophosphorylase
MPSVMRILDANANRAREALRVMEEAARFVLDHSELAGELKRLRHDLAAAMAVFPEASAWRDTPGDVGTRSSTESEATRRSVRHVALAAGRRLSEALRAIEEYGKVRDADFGRTIEALRYRGYDLEQRLTLALGSGRRRQWRLCVLLSECLCPGNDWYAVAQAAVDGGADCLQLREKALDGGDLLDRARRLRTLCEPRGVSLMVNDRPDIALLAGADGVHVGQGDLPVAAVRRLVGDQLLVGVSTSSLPEAQRALAEGADYCGVGPMFPTTTKHKDVIVGPAYLQAYLAWGGLPHLAIGGITAANIGTLAAAAPGLVGGEFSGLRRRRPGGGLPEAPGGPGPRGSESRGSGEAGYRLTASRDMLSGLQAGMQGVSYAKVCEGVGAGDGGSGGGVFDAEGHPRLGGRGSGPQARRHAGD